MAPKGASLRDTIIENFEREPLNKMYNQIFKRPFDENFSDFYNFNRYRRKRAKVDASIFDSALSHTRRSDASERREENSVSTCGQVSSPRLYRLKFGFKFIVSSLILLY